MMFTNKKVKTGVAGLMLAFAAVAMTGCENSADVQRKPTVVGEMVENSLAVCQLSSSDTQSAYRSRLTQVLMDVRTKKLDELNAKHVTICLDSRLASQKSGFFDDQILGVLYNADPQHPVLSLFDNFNKGRFLHTNTKDYGSEVVSELADQYKDGDVSPADQFKYAADYVYSCGTNCTSDDVEIRSPGDFDKGSIAKNPQLKTPPLKSAASSAHNFGKNW
ncbi:MAG: hypothetical protein GC185_08865 [Alphaproteobacteria bacterium]|nr:hypothetical protein [Alphaproteobacteria bacterium]